MHSLNRPILAGLCLAGLILPTTLGAQGASDVFELGTIHVADDADGQGGSTSTITGEQAKEHNRVTLEDALGVLPGVSATSSGGGSRNEREVFVRGFDRWHVPLSIDGIRIFLPADNRLDYGRFLTPDLSEIQVQKGYVSVLNGPGGMGGAINLVTKTPTKPFEGEARLGYEFGNRGNISGHNNYLSLGTRQERWYAQMTWIERKTNGFYLSRDFVGRAQQGGGLRDYSDTSDSRLNLKVGYTPNATDEYVLGYTRQNGSKNAPYNTLLPMRGVDGTGSGSFQRDWSWPEWDIDSLAFYGHTALDTGYVKTRFYYNTFKNTLSAWDNAYHQTQATMAGRIFDSVYDDYSFGASTEYGTQIGPHEIKAAFHFRRDIHRATDYPSPGATPRPAAKPTEHSSEDTYSIAIEDSWRVHDDLRVIGGIGFDRASVKEAKRTDTNAGLDPASTNAVNWQMAAIWTPGSGGEYHASVSSRTSFPTLFHRYSTRFGSMEPNPGLKAERATNFEIGYRGDIGPMQVEGAVFYSEVSDLIQSVFLRYEGNDEISQQQNVGKGRYQGFEIGAGWEIDERWGIKANYTYLDTRITDPAINGLRITDIPRNKFYFGLDWQALDTLRLSPSVEIHSARWSDPAIGSGDAENPIYTRMGGFVLANLGGHWQVAPRTGIDFGVRNIFDRNIETVEGFPEAGRNFYVTSQIRF